MWCHSVHCQYLALFSRNADWLIVLDCLRRCCRCGRWMSSYKSNRAGSWCSLWGFRRCGLFAFVHICHHWKNCLHSEVAATWCQMIVDSWCCHITVPYSDIFGLLLTKAQQSPSGTMQQSMKSQACFSVLFVLFVFTFECCCFKHNSMSE